MNIEEIVQELNQRKDKLQLGGGQERIDRQHEAGSLTARERIDVMLDQDSFQEAGLFAKHRCTNFGMTGKEMAADGVVTGAGSINGRLVHLASQDFTVAGGAAGEVHCAKIVQMMQASLKTDEPLGSGSFRRGR